MGAISIRVAAGAASGRKVPPVAPTGAPQEEQNAASLAIAAPHFVQVFISGLPLQQRGLPIVFFITQRSTVLDESKTIANRQTTVV